MAAYLATYVVCAALSAACSVLSLLVLPYAAGARDKGAPGCPGAAAVAAGAVALVSFMPVPWLHAANVLGWAAAAFGLRRLPAWRPAVLVAYLVAAAAVTRLLALGVQTHFVS